MRRVADALRARSAGDLVVELSLIFIGIVLALAVDGWLERQREAAVAEQSLELVRNDLLQLIEQADEVEAHNRRVLEAIGVVWAALDQPGLVDEDPEVFEALSVMMWRRTVRWPRAAYEEMVATGNLRALSDADLRSSMVRFYQVLQRDEEIMLRNNEAFTDDHYVGLLVDGGLVVNVPLSDAAYSMDAARTTDEIRAQYLPVDQMFRGRLWDLPADHPDRARLLTAVTSLSTPAAGHVAQADRVREGARELIDRIDASLGGEGDG